MMSRYKSPGTAVISKEGRRFDNSALKRSMEIPGPGNYNGAESMIKVKTLIGAHEFGKERRLKDIPTERKSKLYQFLKPFSFTWSRLVQILE